MSTWEVYAVKYADQMNRIRARNIMYTDGHDTVEPIDFFMWVLRRGDEVILVDTGYDQAEAKRRSYTVNIEPHDALAPLGIRPEEITKLIVTHLHFDHAGGLHLFPNATLHIQAAEMAYATGPCMCHTVLQMPYTADHICEAVQRLYSGRMIFHDGDGQVADGVTVHRIGGHSRGLQAVRVRTEAGWLCLASDASHFYENLFTNNPFPLVVDVQDMLDGYGILRRLASRPALIVPGHDPMVGQIYPIGPADHIWRLDHGPTGPLPTFE